MSRSVSKLTGSLPAACSVATWVPFRTVSSPSAPSLGANSSTTRAGSGGLRRTPIRSRKVRKFFSGTLLSR